MKWKRGLPKKDGRYIITNVSNYVTDYFFTVEGGWNTHKTDGELHAENKIADDRVRGWMEYPKPMTDPETIEFDVEWEGGED